MAHWSFDEAIRSFDLAIESDPTYPHLYLYKGLSLAELGRYEEAIAALSQAMRIQPNNFVFPLCLGCIHFDEGQVDVAAEAFGRAAALAPTNQLVSSYKLLTDYAKGDKRALDRLVSKLAQMPDGFKARLLLVAPDWTECTPPERTGAKRLAGCGAVSRWLQQVQMRRLARRAQRLFDRRNYKGVVDLLRGRELQASFQALLNHAQGAVLKELDLRLNQIPEATGHLGSRLSVKRRLAHERERRRLLLSIADLRADDRSRASDLDRWLNSYRQSGRPKQAQALAAEILVEMAEVERRRSRLDVALQLCEKSRAEGGVGDVDWIEAQIRARAGSYRHARRLLERFAHSRFSSFNQRVNAQVTQRLTADISTRLASTH